MNQLCYQTGGGRFLRSFTPFTTLRLTSPLAQGFQSPLRTQFQHVFSGSSYESWNVNQKKKKKLLQLQSSLCTFGPQALLMLQNKYPRHHKQLEEKFLD